MTIENNYFPEAFAFIRNDEGGYVNNPSDKGGETYSGISRIYYPSWDGWRIIDAVKNAYPYNLKKEKFESELEKTGIINKVMEFYKKNYWDPIRCSEIENKEISLKLFDTAVNLGAGRAIRIVQSSINAMSFPLDYEIGIDGVMGSLTLALINKISEKESKMLLNLITLQQGEIYISLAKNNKNQRKFLRGWINRLEMKVELF